MAFRTFVPLVGHAPVRACTNLDHIPGTGAQHYRNFIRRQIAFLEDDNIPVWNRM